ncbi:MAG: carboxymuconolactone decarboxylase family protein [Phycisphaerae bacterium]|nr:carboxymuconolactone decarboxylase family protein [Phycisphaerae bacterium]
MSAPRQKKSPAKKSSKVPATYKAFVKKYPDLGRAHEHIASAVVAAGPLDAKTLSLIKIGICVGAGLESALRSHVRRAMQHGATHAEVEQAVLLAMNTVGFPRTVAAWSWAHEQFARGD